MGEGQGRVSGGPSRTNPWVFTQSVPPMNLFLQSFFNLLRLLFIRSSILLQSSFTPSSSVLHQSLFNLQLPYTRFASTVHGCFGPTVVRKTIKLITSLLGTPRDLAFSNLNQIARRERRWIPPVKTHTYMCSARNLENARLENEVKRTKPWLLKTNVLATVGY